MSSANEFILNNEIAPVFHDGICTYNEAISTGVLLPIQFQFRKIFEKNNKFLDILDEMNTIVKERREHFITGTHWQN